MNNDSTLIQTTMQKSIKNILEIDKLTDLTDTTHNTDRYM